MWTLPLASEISSYGDTLEGKNFCEATFTFPDQPEEPASGSASP